MFRREKMPHYKDRKPILFTQNQVDSSSSQGDLFDQALAEILGREPGQEDRLDRTRVRIFSTAIDGDGRQVRTR
jgi:hypothetical protein